MGKLISIIVPVYNVGQYLIRCVESIISQSYTNWELILVDDGSTDNSGHISDDFSNRDARIKVIHTENRGRSCARNIGIDTSCGEWIVFIDSDDYVGRDYLQCMINANPSWDQSLLVTQGFNAIRSDGEPDDRYPAANYNDYSFSAGESQNIISSNRLLHRQAVWGRLFSVEIIKKNSLTFPAGVNKCEDGVFLHSYMIHCTQFKFISARNYYYVTPIKSEKKAVKKNYYQNFRLAEIYSTLSLQLIGHFHLQATDYSSLVANMFHYPFSYVVFDRQCPVSLRNDAKRLSRAVLKYKKIKNYHDVIVQIRYILLWLHLL